jgi:hypothetical protein
MNVETRRQELLPLEPAHRSDSPSGSGVGYRAWVAFVVVALLRLNVLSDLTYAIVVAAGPLHCRLRRPSGPGHLKRVRLATTFGRGGRRELCRSQPLV